MQRSRTRILIGLGAVALAADMIVGIPWFISWPLLFGGLFLVVWGVAPASVIRAVAIVPRGAQLVAALNKFDRWVAGVSGPSESLEQLSYKMDDGLKILNRIVGSEGEFAEWKTDYSSWINEVFSEIQTNFSRAQAITFRSVGSVRAASMPPCFNGEHNTLKLHLNKRIDNLRHFLDAQSNKL